MLRSRARRFLSTSTSEPLIDVLIVGGGAVGLAIARALPVDKSVFLVERERKFGMGISSRSSEVVHAGIYYPKGSLKAKWCVEGRRLLKKYCHDKGVPYHQKGKLIVATEQNQEAALLKVAAHAQANGVGNTENAWEELKLLDGKAAQKMEPSLRCTAALFSPSTAVFDSHLYMEALEADAMTNGVSFVYGSKFVNGELKRDSKKSYFEVTLESSEGDLGKVACASIINCAGLHAPYIAQSIKTGIDSHDGNLPKAYFAKGNYFKLDAGVRNPFERLIYPLPEAHGLGVHLTISIEGGARFGPDVEWIDELKPDSYMVNPQRGKVFYSAIRSYWPDLPDDSLVPDYAGIRPKLGPASMPASDFFVLGPKQHKVPGLLHLLGIESPGLTSSLAMANDVVKELVR